MSVVHQNAAWDAVGLSSPERLLLLCYARHACEFCGTCWPGNARLQILTGLGETSISNCQKALVRHGVLKIHAYPRGGRGRATEVIVLMAGTELSTGPCGKCVEKMQTPRRAGGIAAPTTENPPPDGM